MTEDIKTHLLQQLGDLQEKLHAVLNYPDPGVGLRLQVMERFTLEGMQTLAVAVSHLVLQAETEK